MRLLLLCPLLCAGLFLVVAFDYSARSVSDFERVQLSDYRSYIREIGGRPKQIVIKAGRKEYFLSSELMEGRTFAEILHILNSSTEVVLWVAWYQGRHWVMGIAADGRLIISPAQAVKFHEGQRRGGLWAAVGCLVAAIFLYFFIKKHEGRDWKLSRKSQWKEPNWPLRGSRRRGRGGN